MYQFITFVQSPDTFLWIQHLQLKLLSGWSPSMAAIWKAAFPPRWLILSSKFSSVSLMASINKLGNVVVVLDIIFQFSQHLATLQYLLHQGFRNQGVVFGRLTELRCYQVQRVQCQEGRVSCCFRLYQQCLEHLAALYPRFNDPGRRYFIIIYLGQHINDILHVHWFNSFYKGRCFIFFKFWKTSGRSFWRYFL